MEQSTRAALNAHLLLRQATTDINAGLDDVQTNKLRITDLLHKNVLLTAEKQLLQMKLDQYDGNFGDDNMKLRRELQTKLELLQLLVQERDLLLNKDVELAPDEEQARLIQEIM